MRRNVDVIHFTYYMGGHTSHETALQKLPSSDFLSISCHIAQTHAVRHELRYVLRRVGFLCELTSAVCVLTSALSPEVPGVVGLSSGGGSTVNEGFVRGTVPAAVVLRKHSQQSGRRCRQEC